MAGPEAGRGRVRSRRRCWGREKAKGGEGGDGGEDSCEELARDLAAVGRKGFVADVEVEGSGGIDYPRLDEAVGEGEGL